MFFSKSKEYSPIITGTNQTKYMQRQCLEPLTKSWNRFTSSFSSSAESCFMYCMSHSACRDLLFWCLSSRLREKIGVRRWCNPNAVRIISTRLLKRLALRHWVQCQGLAVSTGSNLTVKCVIIAIVEGWGRQGNRRRGSGDGRQGWMDGCRFESWN